MIIKSLKFENFKGVGREVRFDFKPITLFFGENSAGKSTVLHALNYLHDILNSHSINADNTSLGHDDIDLGGFKGFVNNHDLTKKIKLNLTLDVDRIDLIETNAAFLYNELYEFRLTDTEDYKLPDLSEVTSLIDEIEIDLSIEWSSILNRPYIDELVITFNDEKLLVVHATSDCSRREITYFNVEHSIFTGGEFNLPDVIEGVVLEQFLDLNGNCLIGLDNAQDALPDYKKNISISDIWEGDDWENADRKIVVKGLINILLLGPLEIAAEELQALRYLGPIREIPGRDYSPRKETNENWADGLAAWDVLFKEGGSFVDTVNHWLDGDEEHERLNTGYKVKTTENKQLEKNSELMSLLQKTSLDENRVEIDKLIESLAVKKGFLLKDTRRDVDVYPSDVGIGISQLLPVVVGALSSEVKILSIEQPELHIHPGLQTAIGDLLIYASQKVGKILILETHSEHIMLRLLRRIRETWNNELENDEYALSPDDINVVYVTCVEGETRLTELSVDEEGEFVDRWPKGFFAERAEELF